MPPSVPERAQFVRPQPTSALEDSLLATQPFKLDLLTPVEGPEVVVRVAVRMVVRVTAQEWCVWVCICCRMHAAVRRDV